MRKLIILVTSICFTAFTQAQNKSLAVNPTRNCGTSAPDAQFEAWVQTLQANQSNAKGPGNNNNSTMAIFNIPVIVHVVHNNEPVNSPAATTGNNINSAQIQNQINILNRDFNGLNPDTSLIPAVFKPLLGKFQFNFCLAVVNPTGGVLPEPGIDRVNRVAKGWNAFPYTMAYTDGTVKPNSIWDPNRYLNMWTVPLSGGILGYATFPNPGTSGLSGLPAPYGSMTTDGLVMPPQYFGSIGTAAASVPYNGGRTVVHEIGHWVGLRHIWGDGTCASDFCNDTPPAQTSNGGCPAHPYKVGVCGGNTTGEMTMNYMDYTNDACMYMFSADQKNRAQLIMTHSPMRAALLTSTVCNLPTVVNDLAIINVISPTYSQVINCISTLSPSIRVSNMGSNVVTSAIYNYSVTGKPTQTFTWTGSLAPGATATVNLPPVINITNGPKNFTVNLSSVNGGADSNPSNNNNMQNFSVTGSFTLSATSATICSGSSATLTASGGAINYTWTPGTITGTQAVVNPTTTTVYTLSGSTGTCVNTRTTNVTVSGSLSINVNTASICSGNSTTLTATGATTYTWNTGATTSSIVVSPIATTVYTVNGTAGTCSGNKTTTVTVNTNPTVTVNNATICSGGTATLTATGASTYSWNTGATTNVLNPTPTVTTIYTVTGTNGTCNNVKSATVTVSGAISMSVVASNTNICSGTNATLTASGATTYTWNTGATSAIVVVSPSTSTTYTVTGSIGACSANRTITVNSTITPTVTVNNTTVCAGNTATLTATGASSYSWNTGATTSVINPSPAGTTVYTVTGSNGTCTHVRTVTVTVAANPTVTVNSSTICSGNSASLNASGASTYSWNTGATAAGIVVSPLTSASYTVTGTNTAGCKANSISNVLVNTTPTVAVSDVTICSGGTTTLIASGASAYSWNTGATSANIVVSPATSTIYTVTGTNSGCTNTKTVSVTIGTALSINVAASSTAICAGSSANLTASGATTYTWNTGSNSNAISVSPSSSTIYTVNGNSGTCAGTTTINISVNALPGATASSTLATCPTCSDGAVSVSTSGTGPFTYNWIPGNITTQSVGSLPVGCYTVTVTDANGCTNNSNACVTSQSPTSLLQNTSLSFEVYPNPTNGLLSIVTTASELKTIRLVDVTGRVILEIEEGNQLFSLDLSTYSKGVYYLSVKTANGTQTKKVIKD